MSYSQLILRDSAEIVWPLDDISDSSSASKPINFISRDPFTFSASINTNATNLFSTPMIFGGGTALSFTSSAVGLSIPALGRFSELYNNKDSVISFWFQVNSLSNQERPIFKKRGQQNIGLFIKDNYLTFKYGTSASYIQVSADLADPADPHHIILSKTRTGLYLTVDGISYSQFSGLIDLPQDNSHSGNDYLDFYGPDDNNWIIDCIAIFPNTLNEQTAKRHYVYGLGKNISDDVFYSRGGNLYNFSTSVTERMGDINWDYPDEWDINELVDLYVDDSGIRPLNFSPVTLYSFDNNIDKTSNSIKFSSSAQPTQASYIQIDNLHEKIEGGDFPFFIKIKLDGNLPDAFLSQKILTYGIFPENEIVNFDLFNDNGTYKIVVTTIADQYLEFPVTVPLTASSLYIGLNFTGYSTVFFAEQGQAIQSASFSYIDEEGFGLDPLTGYFPPPSETVIRIGSSLSYDETSFSSNVFGTKQFYGTFEKFLVVQEDFTASANYEYLDSYDKPKYELLYDSLESRFRVRTYGYGDFNVHMIDVAEYIDDDLQILGGNIVKIGYPDIPSSNQVKVYATLLDYENNVIEERTPLSQVNYLSFLNNRNLLDQYLKIDFEVLAEDAIIYPPRIKYFQMQTFKSTNNTTVIRDEAGPDYVLYPTSASTVFVPEIRYTPTTYITEQSGLKVENTVVEFTENFSAKPLDPNLIEGLQLWLDARFINGLDKEGPDDDTLLSSWTDLSDEGNDALSISASAPVYRRQSLNLLRVNQATGGDSDDISFILPVNSFVNPSSEGIVSGDRGLELTPSGSDVDSYIDLTFNTASVNTFAGQQYTVVGTIKLLKPQTASPLFIDARKIVIYDFDGTTEVFSASSIAAPNERGVYSLSTTFTTASSSLMSVIRLYNGSDDPSDVVYWDNIGIYPITSGSLVTEWFIPLTFNDRPSVRFNGKNMYIESSASSSHPSSLYIVGRNFGEGAYVESTTASILFNNNQHYFLSYGSPQEYQDSAASTPDFKIFSILDDIDDTDLYINGELIDSKDAGHDPIDKLIIGKKLKGDIAALLLYNGKHSNEDREKIEEWLNESFDVF